MDLLLELLFTAALGAVELTFGVLGGVALEHLEASMAAFLIAHEDCPPQLVEFQRGEWSLVCWCRWCSDLETFEVQVG